MATSEAKELTINQHLESLDDSMEDGPAGNETPEAFLRRLNNEARSLTGAIEALTVNDVDEIWEEVNDEEVGTA